MSKARRWAFSLMSVVCFVVMIAATVYAVTPDEYQSTVSKDWLIGILVVLIGFLGGIGVNEILKRLTRIEQNVSRQSTHIRLIEQHIKLDLPDEI